MTSEEKTTHPDACLKNVHTEILSDATVSCCDIYPVIGDYSYYHYCMDGLDDRGWGCGYRTCQTICSWLHFCKATKLSQISGHVPSIREIQKVLVKIGDKPDTFVGSRDWIGSVEIAMCTDVLYGVPCRLLHVPAGRIREHVDTIRDHFVGGRGPIMMGGDCDNSSKCIAGVAVHRENNSAYFIVIDPHCSESVTSAVELRKMNWVKWMSVDELDSTSFYNLCMPVFRSNDVCN